MGGMSGDGSGLMSPGHVTYTCIQSTWKDCEFHLTAKQNKTKNQDRAWCWLPVIPAEFKVILLRQPGLCGTLSPTGNGTASESSCYCFTGAGMAGVLSICQFASMSACWAGAPPLSHCLTLCLFWKLLKITECSRCPKRWGGGMGCGTVLKWDLGLSFVLMFMRSQ